MNIQMKDITSEMAEQIRIIFQELYTSLNISVPVEVTWSTIVPLDPVMLLNDTNALTSGKHLFSTMIVR